jgi:hypothetical protein
MDSVHTSATNAATPTSGIVTQGLVPPAPAPTHMLCKTKHVAAGHGISCFNPCFNLRTPREAIILIHAMTLIDHQRDHHALKKKKMTCSVRTTADMRYHAHFPCEPSPVGYDAPQMRHNVSCKPPLMQHTAKDVRIWNGGNNKANRGWSHTYSTARQSVPVYHWPGTLLSTRLLLLTIPNISCHPGTVQHLLWLLRWLLLWRLVGKHGVPLPIQVM